MRAGRGRRWSFSQRPRFNHEFLTAIDDLGSETRVRWIPIHLDAGRGWLGPAILRERRRPTGTCSLAGRPPAKSLPLFHALTNPPVHGTPYVPPDTELLWMLAILLADVERWVTGVAHLSSWSEVELDPLSFEMTAHPVLPLPERDGLPPPRPFDMGVFVDERAGIVNRLEPLVAHPSVPGTLTIVQSVACDMRRISHSANGRCNHGSSFVSERARAAAIAECIERYCGNWIDSSRLVEASFVELAADQERFLDPNSWCPSLPRAVRCSRVPPRPLHARPACPLGAGCVPDL